LESEDDSALGAIAGKAQVFGAPTLLSPGAQTTTITKLAAGHYGVVCFIPAPDGKPHFAHGMVKTFDVSSSKSNLTPPKDGLVAVSLSDDAVTLPASGMPAHGWAKVTNNATDPRDFTIARFTTPTATFEEADAYYAAFFESGPPAGDPPATLDGGAQTVAPGGTAYVQLDLDAGRYAIVSDTEDDMDGTKEIHQEFTVK